MKTTHTFKLHGIQDVHYYYYTKYLAECSDCYNEPGSYGSTIMYILVINESETCSLPVESLLYFLCNVRVDIIMMKTLLAVATCLLLCHWAGRCILRSLLFLAFIEAFASLSPEGSGPGRVLCVEDCGAYTLSRIGMFSTVNECCNDNGGGGFLLYYGRISCSSCTPFRGDNTPHYIRSMNPLALPSSCLRHRELFYHRVKWKLYSWLTVPADMHSDGCLLPSHYLLVRSSRADQF